ncbi:hypothetical protein KEM56_006622 [Ascosphaera pollenicola]|nr:hypothetical protein KEM56_006622 [Ascosphaera pollenicola]
MSSSEVPDQESAKAISHQLFSSPSVPEDSGATTTAKARSQPQSSPSSHPESFAPSQHTPSTGSKDIADTSAQRSEGLSFLLESSPFPRPPSPLSSPEPSTRGNSVSSMLSDHTNITDLHWMKTVKMNCGKKTPPPSIVYENGLYKPRLSDGQAEHFLTLLAVGDVNNKLCSKAFAEYQTRIDPFSCLPWEISLLVLKYFSPYELWRLSHVCQHWKKLCRDPQLLQDIDADEHYKVYPGEVLLRQFGDAGPFLKKLRLRGCKQLGSLWRKYHNLTTSEGRLEYLSVMHSGLPTPHAREIIASNPELKELEIPGYKMLDKSAISAIRSLKNLQSLNISCCQFDDNADLSRIAKDCRQLRHLKMMHVDGVISFSRLMRKLWKLNTLETLDMSNSRHLTDADLRILAVGVPDEVTDPSIPPRKLKVFRAPRCHKITTKGVAHLIYRCPNLEVLDISNIRKVIDDSELKDMTSCLPNLRSFACRNSAAMSNDVLIHMSNLPCAKNLEEVLVGSSYDIYDSGVLHILSRCPKLMRLGVDYTNITDQTVFEACFQVLNRGVTTNKYPKLGLILECYDCYGISWAALEQTMVANSHIIRLDDRLGKDYGDLSAFLQEDPRLFFQTPEKSDAGSGDHEVVYPAQILQLQCGYQWRDAIKAHTSLLLNGERKRAIRLAHRWTNVTLVHEGSARYQQAYGRWINWRLGQQPSENKTFMRLPRPSVFLPMGNERSPVADISLANLTIAVLESSKEYEEDDKIYPPGLDVQEAAKGKYQTGPRCAAM